jgi:hypothetical protein
MRKDKKEQERIDRQAEEAWENDHPEWYKPSNETDGEYEEVQGEMSDDE